MFLLTSSGTFTASQYESITESTKLAIDGLLDVFSRLAPLYGLLCVLSFGVAFVLLLFHIVSHGGDMEKATAPLDSKSIHSDWLEERQNKEFYSLDNDYLPDGLSFSDIENDSKSDIIDRADSILNSDDEFTRNMKSEEFFRKYYDPEDDTYRKRRYYNW